MQRAAIVALQAAALLASPSVLVAYSLTAHFSPNNVQLLSDAQADYSGPSVTDSTGVSLVQKTVWPALSTGSTMASNSLLPFASTVSKDIAKGAEQTSFTFGSPYSAAPLDEFHFLTNSTASAVDAHNTAGENANAQVSLDGRVHFYLDHTFGGSPPGALVGQMYIPVPKVTDPSFEFAEIRFLRDSVVLLEIPSAASTGHWAPLFADHNYDIQFMYKENVPFGTDPQFQHDYPLYIAPFLKGDMNGDGSFNNFDITPFVMALTDPNLYAMRFPGLDPLPRGDMNNDGSFNNFDITPFVTALTTPHAPSPVPEPGIAVLGLAGIALARRQRPRQHPRPRA